MIYCVRERILREAQEQQRRAQLEYEEKNKLIVTMQNQLKEMQEFQQVGNCEEEILLLQCVFVYCRHSCNGLRNKIEHTWRRLKNIKRLIYVHIMTSYKTCYRNLLKLRHLVRGLGYVIRGLILIVKRSP